ncbi:restriction endonuclease subunit S [Hornefia butyriciproducens]|uniref:restriction endonuclease subunit S n=1 Tax=Hornefia butyriciproducens TaxID=2652293 RepID=UPI003F8B0F09
MPERKTPQVRFKGFTDTWEQRKLSEVTTEFNSGEGIKADEIEENGTYPVYGGNGLRGYTERYNHDGEYALIGRQGALCGNMNYSVGKAYFTEHAVAVKANESNDTRFLYYLLDRMDLGRYSDQSAQPGLAVNKLIVLHTYVPRKQEQEAIGVCFKSLDHLITLHQRECERLQMVKKSMLENCFPKNGEKVPRFRFAGFTGDWEQRKLGDCFSLLQNNTLSRAELSNGNGVAMNVHYGDVLIKFDECLDVSKEQLPFIEKHSVADKLKTSYLQNGDVIVADTAEDETVGKCTEIMGVTDQKVISGLHTIPLRPNGKFATGYLGFYLNSAAYHDQLKPLMQGIKVTSISKSAMQDTVIRYPSDIKEQELIGRYFINLDHLITLHQSKLEMLKKIKKSMLGKILV